MNVEHVFFFSEGVRKVLEKRLVDDGKSVISCTEWIVKLLFVQHSTNGNMWTALDSDLNLLSPFSTTLISRPYHIYATQEEEKHP